MIDKKKIGERIIEARLALGIETPGALAAKLQEAAKLRHPAKAKPRFSRQTVQHWEKGKVVPPWDKIELLAAVLGGEYDEEWIMFGRRRQQQLATEKPFLVHVSPEEIELLSDFRRSNEYGKRSIRINAKAVALDQPSPEADMHQMRRSTDLTK